MTDDQWQTHRSSDIFFTKEESRRKILRRYLARINHTQGPNPAQHDILDHFCRQTADVGDEHVGVSHAGCAKSSSSGERHQETAKSQGRHAQAERAHRDCASRPHKRIWRSYKAASSRSNELTREMEMDILSLAFRPLCERVRRSSKTQARGRAQVHAVRTFSHVHRLFA